MAKQKNIDKYLESMANKYDGILCVEFNLCARYYGLVCAAARLSEEIFNHIDEETCNDTGFIYDDFVKMPVVDWSDVYQAQKYIGKVMKYHAIVTERDNAMLAGVHEDNEDEDEDEV